MTGRDRQTMADAALLATGSMEGVFDLARTNNVSLSDSISGIELEETSLVDGKAQDYIANGNHIPATEALLQTEEEFVTDSEGVILTTSQNENLEL